MPVSSSLRYIPRISYFYPPLLIGRLPSSNPVKDQLTFQSATLSIPFIQTFLFFVFLLTFGMCCVVSNSTNAIPYHLCQAVSWYYILRNWGPSRSHNYLFTLSVQFSEQDVLTLILLTSRLDTSFGCSRGSVGWGGSCSVLCRMFSNTLGL